MSEDLRRQMAGVIALWEANPKRQALAKMLKLPPGQITDEMIARVERGSGKVKVIGYTW